MKKESQHIGEEIYIHIRKNLVELGETIGQIAVAHIQREIISQGRIATYELYNSISYQLNQIMNDVVVKIFSSVPYAIYLNRGTSDYGRMPPQQKIAEWIIAKRSSIGFAIYEGTVDSVAWAIAYTIKQKGTPATKFFDIGMLNAMPEINKKISEMEL